MNTVTKGEVMANMKEVVCRTEEVLGKPVTHVSVRMKNGFTLHETTTCVDPENYDERIGRLYLPSAVLRKRFGSCWIRSSRQISF